MKTEVSNIEIHENLEHIFISHIILSASARRFSSYRPPYVMTD